MNIKQLYEQLKYGYTIENLNKISAIIIEAYRDKNFTFLKKMSQRISDTLLISESKINKVFARLMFLYHPDKLEFYQKAIDRHFSAGETVQLQQLSHIFRILEYIDQVPLKSAKPASDLNPEYRYDTTATDDPGRTTYETVDLYEGGDYQIEVEHNFFTALKHKEYGNLDVVYHEEDLRNVEGDLELSNYNIFDLSGLELCENLIALDLSNNRIFDISAIRELHLLEEIDFSFNQIMYVDSLAGKNYLRRIDVSFNQIEDISPLLTLRKLEYLNVVGNPIPKSQIDEFRSRGVLVISEFL